MERPGLEHHVVLRSQTDTGTEDVLHSVALLGKRVHNGSSRRNHGCLEQVAEDRQDRVEGRKRSHVARLISDASHELGDDGQVDDERRSKKRVLADVVD